jgi:tetrapyrrole methylase family protein/MazG family protein
MDKKYTFEDLLEIVEKLRGKDGCPWDMEQTHESIKHNIIEEGYELIEMLERGDAEKIADESGDLLLQVVFHAQIGKENGEYDMDDVISAVCSKLIHRHPHVFGDVMVKNSDEVLENWNRIKREDRGQKTISEDMDGISKALPALMRAQKIQKKAEKSGYIFGTPLDVAESISNMINILSNNENNDVAEKYIGKMLFELVAVAKKSGVDAETALNRYANEFVKEYAKHEE